MSKPFAAFLVAEQLSTSGQQLSGTICCKIGIARVKILMEVYGLFMEFSSVTGVIGNSGDMSRQLLLS
jgi:hypothetical protein